MLFLWIDGPVAYGALQAPRAANPSKLSASNLDHQEVLDVPALVQAAADKAGVRAVITVGIVRATGRLTALSFYFWLLVRWGLRFASIYVQERGQGAVLRAELL